MAEFAQPCLFLAQRELCPSCLLPYGRVQLVSDLRSGRIWPANMEDCPQSWTLGQTFLDKTAPHQASLTEIL